MTRRTDPRALGIALGLLTLAIPMSSAADPVTLNYSVLINQRCQGGSCQPFQSTFDLVVTFDSTAVTSGPGFVVYGDPTFSPVPLERPAISPAAGDSLNTRTGEVATQSQTHVSYSFFAQREYATANNLEEWHVGLSLARQIMAMPDLSSETLAARLLALGPARFTYFYDALDPVTGNLMSSSIGYSGLARLSDASPVPEPASLLLLGSGVAGLAAWRRHRRNYRARDSRLDRDVAIKTVPPS
jgi:hypothetical protein